MADNDIDPSIDLEPGAPGNQDDEQSDDDEDTPASAETDDDESGDTDDESEPEETYEFEDDGKKYKIPASLKGHLLRQADYSRGMNALKENETSLAARESRLGEWRNTEEAHQRTLGQLVDIDHQLKHFIKGADGTVIGADQVDWVSWQQNNPQQAQQALLRFNALNQQRTALAKQADEGKQKYETEAKQKTAERLRATRDFAEKEIPTWSPERDKAITRLVLSDIGMSQDEAIRTMSPKMYLLADLALDGHRYREARAKRSTTAKKVEKDNVTPLTTVAKQRSGGTGTGLSDRLSTKEWIERRNKQLQRKTG